MSNRTEEVEQAAVIAWAQSKLREHPELAFLFHVPNGGKRDAFTGGQMKALGVKPGVPDLLLPLHRMRTFGPLETHKHGLVIEMKSERGRLSPEQEAWLAHLHAQGWVTTVCRSAEAAINAIENYLAGNFGAIPSAVV